MRQFFLLLKRELKLFSTNGVVIAIFIGAPLLYGLVLGGVYSKGKVDNLPVLVIDLDDSPMSHKALEMMSDNEVLNVTVGYDQNNLKQRIIDECFEAIVTIPHRFEADIIQKRHPEVQVEVNTGNILPANYVAKAVQISLGTLNAGIEIEGLKKQGVPEVTARQNYEAFGVNYARFFNKSANYMTFLWPGVLGVIIQQIFMLAFALSFAREFEEKTFHTDFYPFARNPFYGMFVKALPFWVMGVGIILCLWGMFPIFKVPFNADGTAIIALIATLILSVTFIGFAVSIFIPSQLKATEILMVIATPSFILSGFTWPLSQMPDILVIVAKMIPLTHFLEALRKVMLYGADINDVWPQLQALLIITAAFALICFFGYRYKGKKVPTVN